MRLLDSLKRRTATFRMRHLSKVRGIPSASLKRTSDTAFILASGPSINDLNDTQLDQIRSSDSIGFNFWLLHDLIPSFYMIEGFRDPKEAEFFKARLREKSEAYKNVHWLLQAPEILKYVGSMERFFGLFPWEAPPPLSWLSYQRRLLRKEEEYRQGFFAEPPKDLSGRIDKGLGSISLALSICATLGYTRIVICGLDLNRPDYFWNQESHAHESFRKRNPDEEADAHSTSSHHKYHPIQDHILAYQRFVLEPRGIELSLGVKAGLLADALPTFTWQAEEA